MTSVHVDRLDHVHVDVTDREAAAEWFGCILGLIPAEAMEIWAEDARGPLFLRTASGRNALALFARGRRDAVDSTPGDRTVAFAIDGRGFMAFVDRLSEIEITRIEGGRLSRDDVVDHDLSWSLYFLDPDGNRFELTTYDHAVVGERLAVTSTPRSGQP